MEHHGEILRRLLKGRDITQDEFAKMVGVSRVTVVNLIRRDRFTLDWIDKISTVLSVRKEEFTDQNVAEDQQQKYTISDNEKVLTANERQALWDIINTQKEIISRLERQVKDGGGNKE